MTADPRPLADPTEPCATAAARAAGAAETVLCSARRSRATTAPSTSTRRPAAPARRAATPSPFPPRAGRRIAAEWNAQGERIDPSTMPATRLANTALDGVGAPHGRGARRRPGLCWHRPALLPRRRAGGAVARRASSWDPMIAWAEERFGARFVLAEGVMHVAQPPASLAAIGTALSRYERPVRAHRPSYGHHAYRLGARRARARRRRAHDRRRLGGRACGRGLEHAPWGADAEAPRRRVLRRISAPPRSRSAARLERTRHNRYTICRKRDRGWKDVGERVVVALALVGAVIDDVRVRHSDNSARIRRRLLRPPTPQPARLSPEGRVPAQNRKP